MCAGLGLMAWIMFPTPWPPQVVNYEPCISRHHVTVADPLNESLILQKLLIIPVKGKIY